MGVALPDPEERVGADDRGPGLHGVEDPVVLQGV